MDSFEIISDENIVNVLPDPGKITDSLCDLAK